MISYILDWFKKEMNEWRMLVKGRSFFNISLHWRKPDAKEVCYYDREGRAVAALRGFVVGEYFDDVIYIAKYENLTLLIGERIWFGWPDPPQYVFFALDGKENIVGARDFSSFPSPWQFIDQSVG